MNGCVSKEQFQTSRRYIYTEIWPGNDTYFIRNQALSKIELEGNQRELNDKIADGLAETSVITQQSQKDKVLPAILWMH